MQDEKQGHRMTDQEEQQFAHTILLTAAVNAAETSIPEDYEAATSAILMRAFILSTPDLTPLTRAKLFLETEE